MPFNRDEHPEIGCIIDQMGGFGLQSGFTWCGARNYIYSDPPPPKGMKPASDEWDFNECTGLMFEVNAGERAWFMVITVSNDIYSVRLFELRKLLYREDDIYCEMLQKTVEEMYDKALQEQLHLEKDWIPIS